MVDWVDAADLEDWADAVDWVDWHGGPGTLLEASPTISIRLLDCACLAYAHYAIVAFA